MKFAVVEGLRSEAEPGRSGECPACHRPVVAKCGKLRVWHWAHKGTLLCDAWAEGETEWHRAWKGQFPADWQEVVHHAENGERHIADVKTGDGWVLEFQHSPLSTEERRARTVFYKRLNWIVDGTRRKRDVAQFNRALQSGVALAPQGPVRILSEGCRILEEWTEDEATVFFDFGEAQRIWWIVSRAGSKWAYVAPYSRSVFVSSHRGENPEVARQFAAFINELPALIAAYENRLNAPPPIPLPSFRTGYRRPFRF
jgi:competence protein CoiA